MIKTASKHIPLKTLIEIQENMYRSKCGQFEYCSEEIEDEINKKKTNKMLKEVEELNYDQAC